MIVGARWVLLLAAVHRQPGAVIAAVIAAGALAEWFRRRAREERPQSGL